MKKKVVFREGSFVDFKDVEREYTLAAVSCMIDENDESAGDDEVKQLRLGIAVKREGDEYLRGIGMTIAEQKAMEKPFAIIRANRSGVINQSAVEAILEQEASHFECRPEEYLKGYLKESDDYFQGLGVKEIFENLPEGAKMVHDYLLTTSEETIQDLAICVEHSVRQNLKGRE